MSADSLEALRAALSPGGVVIDPAEMAPCLSDWRGRWRGAARALVRPRDTAEAAAVLRWASATATPVVAQGGNTGLCGGATPEPDGRAIVLSLARLDRLRDLDAPGATMTVEAGCVLADVQRRAEEAGFLFPLSLGSDGSAQIGGVIATNAGGINVLRYGPTRNLVLGLEYVLADGHVVDGLSKLRKDNTGYALHQVLIGSEGTLAVLTAAALRLFPRPRRSATALCGLDDPSAALAALSRLRDVCGERLSSFELMCDGEMGLILDQGLAAGLPLGGRRPWYLFVELGDSDPDYPVEDRLAAALGESCEAGEITDVVVAGSVAQARAVWHLRFAVSEANRRAGPLVSHDVSVPVAETPALIHAVEEGLRRRVPAARPLFVGHAGDGNMHVICLFADAESSAAGAEAASETVYEIVGRLGGSISAEHGIGQSLRSRLPRHKSAEEMALMRAIKAAWDPAGILNPGKLL